MQANELKAAIRFDDFWTVFGSQGVIAMAWWLGAKLAEPIRAEHQSFPFLHITGEPGSGKTFLQGYLWKLLGEETFSACDPEHASRAGRLRLLANAGNRVITYEAIPQSPAFKKDEDCFDWDELKSLYSKGATIHYGGAGGMERIEFKGAVTICSNEQIQCGEALESRIVRVFLAGPSFFSGPHFNENRNRAEGLHQLSAEQAGAFGRAVDQRSEALLWHFNQQVPFHTKALLDQHADQLSPRAAKNGGQVMALVEVLSLLIDLTREQRKRVMAQVTYSVCSNFVPY